MPTYQLGSYLMVPRKGHLDQALHIFSYLQPTPGNMLETRGESVTTTCFVDANHVGCRRTHRSHTGILIYVNRVPIIWWSKRQNTVESSTFGSEFIAMKQLIDLIESLRYNQNDVL